MKHRADTAPKTGESPAETYARVTGSVRVTYLVESVKDGCTTMETVETYQRPKHRRDTLTSS